MSLLQDTASTFGSRTSNSFSPCDPPIALARSGKRISDGAAYPTCKAASTNPACLSAVR
jgi:hypothetical protein